MPALAQARSERLGESIEVFADRSSARASTLRGGSVPLLVATKSSLNRGWGGLHIRPPHLRHRPPPRL